MSNILCWTWYLCSRLFVKSTRNFSFTNGESLGIDSVLC